MSNNYKQMAEGFYNLLVNKEEELYESRIAICKECKLLEDDEIFGLMCSRNIYINPKTDEISDKPGVGFINGCGCVMKIKARVQEAECVLNKW